MPPRSQSSIELELPSEPTIGAGVSDRSAQSTERNALRTSVTMPARSSLAPSAKAPVLDDSLPLEAATCCC